MRIEKRSFPVNAGAICLEALTNARQFTDNRIVIYSDKS